MLIAHLTDTHLGLDPGALGGRLDPATALRRALARVRALAPAPAVLLLTGDLAEAGRAADYTLLAELLKQELPAHAGQAPRVLCIIGNHDHRGHARQTLGALMPIAPEAPPPLACVRAEVGGLQFIGLDTVLPGHPHGALDAPQLDWLARQLRDCAGQPVALFMHHPPLTSGIEAMDRCGLRRGRAELARLVAGHGGVQFIACGHVHRPIAGVLGGAPVLVAPSTSHQLELDLRPGAPLALRLEPPMMGLYRWTAQDGVSCHFGHVQAFEGPFPI